MRVLKWGRSLAVRLPANLVREMDLKAGDEVQIRCLDDDAERVVRASKREAALARLRAYRGSLPADFKFDRDEAHTR